MRAVTVCAVALGLITFPPLARPDGTKDKETDEKAKEGAKSTTLAEPNAAARNSGPASRERAAIEVELQRVHDLLKVQAEELESQRAEFRQAIEEQRSQIEILRAQLRSVHSGSASAENGSASVKAASLSAPSSSVSVQPVSFPPGPAGDQKPASPLSVRIGSADFTPGGWIDFTAFFRTTNVGSGIGTSFGSIPFNNATAGRLTETRFSAQNSRLNIKVTAAPGDFNIVGFAEADFVGLQPGNVFVTSNSNAPRMRLYWVDVKHGKWEFLGGQSWSYLTPNRSGISALPADIFAGLQVDPNNHVGLTWTRAPQFRIAYHPNQNWAFGIAFENPEQFIGGAITLPGAFASVYSGELNNGALTTTPNLHPDILPKIAFDGHVGDRHMHVEAVGVVRSFRVFNPATASTSTVTGGGGSLNFNLEILKNLHLIANTFWSDGGGRYTFGLGPDLIIRGDGTPSLVHAGSGLGGFEWQASANNLIFSYYGAVYFQRNTSTDPATGRPVGFGFPGSSSSANRDVQESTLGYVRTLWKNENFGGLQLIPVYSYVMRSPWSVASGAPKNAHESQVYLDLRYVIP